MADNYTVRDASGTTRTFRSKDTGSGVQIAQSVPSAPSGLPYATDNPLPVATRQIAADSTPLAGTASATTLAGPFAPELGRPIVLTLSGSWSGSAELLRSVDAGSTKLPLTVAGGAWGQFTGNCNEPVWQESEAGATFYLSITIASGSVTYRVSQ